MLVLNTSLCNWILDFLMGRPQVTREGSNTSAMLILNTGAPQGCVLSPLLYSLFTHDCMATHDSNTIIKFADDTTVLYLPLLFVLFESPGGIQSLLLQALIRPDHRQR